METTPELIIFLVVGAVAILAAVMMLISENAVHSALFLVLNFACVAFLYLMLQAAFLAMVQITVYAGAIMVLFMFVIMLLGAERLAPEENPRFPWLTNVAVALTLIFLITAGVGILQADISGSEPEPLPPMVRVMNGISEYEAINVHLNDQSIAEELGFRHRTDLTEWETGEVDVHVTAVSEDGTETELALPVLNTEILNLEEGSDITLVVTSAGIIPVVEDFDSVEHGKSANVQVVNAAPELGAIELAEITQADREPVVLTEGIPFGGVSDIIERRSGETAYAVYEAGMVEETAATAGEDDIRVRDVPEIVDIKDLEFESNTSTLLIVTEPLRLGVAGQEPDLIALTVDNRPSFGGPTSVGQLLFTSYMLPFQIIALLLLVSMIGAIVLTRDQVPAPRERFPRRLASTGEPITGESSQD